MPTASIFGNLFFMARHRRQLRAGNYVKPPWSFGQAQGKQTGAGARAGFAASNAAPIFPGFPAISKLWPKLPLCANALRGLGVPLCLRTAIVNFASTVELNLGSRPIQNGYRSKQAFISAASRQSQRLKSKGMCCPDHRVAF